MKALHAKRVAVDKAALLDPALPLGAVINHAPLLPYKLPR